VIFLGSVHTPMPDPAPPFENVNDRAKEDWKRDTSPFDRVRSVMRTAYEPMTAATVADQSLTSEQTARKHLRSLVEHGYLTETASPDSKATLYRRANDSLAVEQARRILDETDAETLSTRVLENQERLREYSERFSANSPDAAVRADADIESKTLLEWRTTRRNLAFANGALSIANAERIVEGDEPIVPEGVYRGIEDIEEEITADKDDLERLMEDQDE
jgi:DNA-binding transcriptional ArsR family regulator